MRSPSYLWSETIRAAPGKDFCRGEAVQADDLLLTQDRDHRLHAAIFRSCIALAVMARLRLRASWS